METREVQQLLEQPADATFSCSSFRANDGVRCILHHDKTEQPLVWILPNVLSGAQCDDLIAKAEAAGMTAAPLAGGSIRTSKRTQNYHDDPLSKQVFSQLPPDFVSRLEQQHDHGLSVDSVHANWRIVRYDPGDYFCPHYDQASVLKRPRNENEGAKDFLFSSHTLIVNLTRDMDALQGGATRFYPNQDYSKAVDVSVPRGWAIAFVQNGVLHAGHQVTHGTKYVAQAGLLRLLPPGQTFKPSTFHLGPNLEEAVKAHAAWLREQNLAPWQLVAQQQQTATTS